MDQFDRFLIRHKPYYTVNFLLFSEFGGAITAENLIPRIIHKIYKNMAENNKNALLTSAVYLKYSNTVNPH